MKPKVIFFLNILIQLFKFNHGMNVEYKRIKINKFEFKIFLKFNFVVH